MVGMVGLIEDVLRIIPSTVKNAGDALYLVGPKTKADFSGSEIQKMQTGKIFGALNELDLPNLNKVMKQLLTAMQTGLVTSSHDASEGGLGVCLAETLFNSELGAKVTLNLSSSEFFSETPGRFIVSVPQNKRTEFEKTLGAAQSFLGEVDSVPKLAVTLIDAEFEVEVSEAQKLWEEAIPCLMKSKD